jgi:hypothetical protein
MAKGTSDLESRLQGTAAELRHLQEEGAALAKNPDDPEYKSWTHVRKYGVSKSRTPMDQKEGNP